MSENVYKYIKDARDYHERLLNANRFRASSFEGLRVFEINRSLREGNGFIINSQDYFHTVNRLPRGLDRDQFIREVYNPHNKKGICLHYTVGHIESDLKSLTGDREDPFVSVPFVISHAGYIYQLSDPDKELSYHLNTHIAPSRQNTQYNNQIIGIELSNLGTNITNIPSEHVFSLQESQQEPYRGQDKFERFTDEQYVALRALILAICRRYPQIEPKILPLDKRYEFFDGPGLDRTYLQNWRGISSHVNWVGEGKWDIGPAFEWDRIIEKEPVCFPLEEENSKAPSWKWYTNTEMHRRGGYFPIGSNNAIHSGVHIFSDEEKAAVKSMANGYVVAFRFFSRKQHQEQSLVLNTIGLKHTRNTGFVLIRHDILKPTVNLGIYTTYTSHALYTLYMDLEIVSEEEMREIPWVKKLLGSHIEKLENVFNGQTFESGGKVITFSQPLLAVKAGETIGYTVKDGSGSNSVHWELFAAETGILQSIMRRNNVTSREIRIETEDGIFSPNELSALFGRQFSISPVSPFHEIIDNNNRPFSYVLDEHYAASEKTYSGKMNVISRSCHDRSEVVIKTYLAGEELMSSISGWKIKVFPEKRRPRDTIDVRVNAMDFVNNKYTVEMPLQVLGKGLELRLQPPLHLDGMTAEINNESFFNEFIKKEHMHRNAVFTNISPWTETTWEKIVTNLQTNRRLNPLYTFNSDDFIEYILFDVSYEYPVYDSIFSGSTAFINPMHQLTYMHPVTFLWMYLCDKENTIQFIHPLSEEIAVK